MSAMSARSPEPMCNTGPANADNAAPPPIIIALPNPDAVPANSGLIANMPAVAFGMLIPLPRLELKHFRAPNTANVRLSSKRAKTMQVLEKDINEQLRWMEKDKADMLEDLAEKNIEELVDRHQAERNERWRRWYRTMPDEGFDKTETWKRTVSSVENMLISQCREFGKG